WSVAVTTHSLANSVSLSALLCICLPCIILPRNLVNIYQFATTSWFVFIFEISISTLKNHLFYCTLCVISYLRTTLPPRYIRFPQYRLYANRYKLFLSSTLLATAKNIRF